MFKNRDNSVHFITHRHTAPAPDFSFFAILHRAVYSSCSSCITAQTTGIAVTSRARNCCPLRPMAPRSFRIS